MSKRFIEPDWKQLRLLPGYLQRAWFYMWDKADEAGVYHYDRDYFKLDLKLTEDVGLGALGCLPDCEILPGERILIKNFLVVNYKKLKPDYNPHKPVFRALERNGLILNSSLNKASIKLEEEGEEEGEERDNAKETKPENSQLIVVQMNEGFKKINPHYPFEKETDFPCLLEIAKKIFKWHGLKGELTSLFNQKIILTRWGELANHVKTDIHLSKYSLAQINKHFQSVVQSFNNGNSAGKKNHVSKPVISGTATGAGTF